MRSSPKAHTCNNFPLQFPSLREQRAPARRRHEAHTHVRVPHKTAVVLASEHLRMDTEHSCNAIMRRNVHPHCCYGAGRVRLQLRMDALHTSCAASPRQRATAFSGCTTRAMSA